jgi:hypothetical protein
MNRQQDRKLRLTRYGLFIAVFTVLKFLLMGMFSSDYQDKLFIPFVMDFLSKGADPYQRFFEDGIMNAFPYPPVMLLVESIGGILVKFSTMGGCSGRTFYLRYRYFWQMLQNAAF